MAANWILWQRARARRGQPRKGIRDAPEHGYSPGMIVDGAQLRAGRALLGWHQTELAAAAGVHWNSIKAVEKMGRISQPDRQRRRLVIERLESALEEAGIVTHSHPVGVFLKR